MLQYNAVTEYVWLVSPTYYVQDFSIYAKLLFLFDGNKQK